MKKTGLTVASFFMLEPAPVAGTIVSHVELNGFPVLTCWHDNWHEYIRCMSLWQFDRVRINECRPPR